MPQMQQIPYNITGVVMIPNKTIVNSYPVAPGQNVLLVDYNAKTAYVRTSNSSGMPILSHVYKYEEVIQETQANPNYISKTEFEDFKNEIRSLLEQRQSYQKPYNNQKKSPKEE